jgi:hypothetical protein
MTTMPVLPAQSSTAWYSHYAAADAVTRGHSASVALESFAGDTDDAKLTAALAAVAAETYPRTIKMAEPRNYTFSTVNRIAFTGMRIAGPEGFGNPEQASNTKMPHRISLTGNGPWFHNNGVDVYSASFYNLSIKGSGTNAGLLGQSGGGTWYCLSMRSIFATDLRFVLGSQATKMLLTAASFTGDWEINGCYGGPFHMGGSDNVLWSDGMLIDSNPAYNTAGNANGQFHILFSYMSKSYVGPLYITAAGGYSGIRVTGPTDPAQGGMGGHLDLVGIRLEGTNATTTDKACNGALLRVEGGIVNWRDGCFNYGMYNPASIPGRTDQGIVHHSGGVLDISGATYDAHGAVAKRVPLVYTSSPADCFVSRVKRGAIGGAWGTQRPVVAKPTANAENRITDASVTLVNV